MRQFVFRGIPPILYDRELRDRNIVPHEKCVLCFSDKSFYCVLWKLKVFVFKPIKTYMTLLTNVVPIHLIFKK